MSTSIGLQAATQALIDTLVAYPGGALKNRVSLWNYDVLNTPHPIYVVVKPGAVEIVPTTFGDNYERQVQLTIDVFIANSRVTPNHSKSYLKLLEWLDNILTHLFVSYNLGQAGNLIESFDVHSISDAEMVEWAKIPAAYASATIQGVATLPETNP